ncbi:ABC transporter permease [Actinokineospora xionganensis]|uniref:ABC transporter permease n=1 Tax=Actinokineospora xionganensis TaxID=2684470 RepID=A0ABR7KZI1_9PSEU|nr:ABC transporter permease [Actinokineospora xionganensis]MBC6445844.1 ABC transporter permease [Actinokineospora xionganensis]
MTALTVTAVELRRLFRDRTAIFFMVLLPIVIILVIGATAGNATALRVGVVTAADTGPLARTLVDDLHAIPGARVTDPADEETARTALRRGELDAVVLIPTDLDATLRAGGTAAIPVLGSGSQAGVQAAQSAVSGAVATHAARVQAARFGVAHSGGTFDQQLATADTVRTMLPAIEVRSETVDADSDYLPRGFGYSAPTMLVLFVFINSLAGGAAIIQARKLGIHRRVMAAPVRARDLVFGETLAYAVIGLLQSLLIVGIGAGLFGVDWGDPTAAAALIGVWVLVGAGTGVLAGTLFSTPEQASAIGPAIGIAFGMLGGAMWPLEIVTPLMRTIGHLVPHAWAVDGWVEVLSRGGGIAQIGTQLAVLGAFALVLLTIASLRLGRRVTE